MSKVICKELFTAKELKNYYVWKEDFLKDTKENIRFKKKN